MTASLDLGDNYQIEENSNGNLVVRDSGGTIVLKHEDGGNFQLGDAGLELGDLIDGSSGATVYDGASETLGDGSQSANQDSLSTNDGTIGGDPILGGPSSGSDAGLTLGGGYTTIDADQPTLIELEVRSETDGSNDANVQVRIDESGGTSFDREFDVFVPSAMGAGAINQQIVTAYIPAVGTVNIRNLDDPNNGNLLIQNYKYTLSS